MKIKKSHIGAFILFCIPPLLFSTVGYLNPHQTLLFGLGFGFGVSIIVSLVSLAMYLIVYNEN